MFGRGLTFLAGAAFFGASLYLPPLAAQDDETIDLAATEKACNRLKGKAARDPVKLEACHIAGRSYGGRYNGVTERDAVKSERYLAKACNGGLGKSCSLLSWYYLDDSAFESSSEKSREWDAKGCEANDATACSGMGYWSKEDGDIEAAKRFYRRALELKPDYEYAKKKLAELEAE